MKTFDVLKRELLEDPEVKREYEAMEQEFSIARELIKINPPAVRPIEVFYSEDDGGYIAIAPDLQGCSAFGSTREEALQEVNDAIESWLEACSDMGRELPEPPAKPLA